LGVPFAAARKSIAAQVRLSVTSPHASRMNTVA
jgi:hypothetical protein